MEIKNNTSVIIQARFNANRFKGKVLKKINGKSILEILVNRLKKSKNINNIIVACPNTLNDRQIIKECKKLKVKYFQGSEENVLKRFFLVIAQKTLLSLNFFFASLEFCHGYFSKSSNFDFNISISFFMFSIL